MRSLIDRAVLADVAPAIPLFYFAHNTDMASIATTLVLLAANDGRFESS